MKTTRPVRNADVIETRSVPVSRVSVAERDVIRAILDYCQAERIFVERRNVGAMKDKAGNYIKFNRKGMADLWGMWRGGRHWECEVKRPGQLPTHEQMEWLYWCEHHGAVAFWADSVEKFMSIARMWL